MPQYCPTCPWIVERVAMAVGDYIAENLHCPTAPQFVESISKLVRVSVEHDTIFCRSKRLLTRSSPHAVGFGQRAEPDDS